VLDEALSMGAPHATLEVRRSNTAARRLYEQAGFALVGVRTSYYTNPIEDALILSRTDGIVPDRNGCISHPTLRKGGGNDG
jgi:ribosomal-protein-alanine N-acetyltransferase